MKDEIWNKPQLETSSSEQTGLEPIEYKLILHSQHARNQDKEEEWPQTKVALGCIWKRPGL